MVCMQTRDEQWNMGTPKNLYSLHACKPTHSTFLPWLFEPLLETSSRGILRAEI